MLEHRLELHAETREVVDIEEAAVVDFVLGDAVKRDAPELLADEPIEFAPVLVERLDPIIDRRPRFFAVIGQRNEFAFQGPRPFRDLRPPLRQVEKKVGHAIQRWVLVAKNLRIGQRTDGQLMGVVRPDRETPVRFEFELELAASELFAILRAQHRREQLPVLSRPIDVEPASVVGVRTPLQNIEPQRIVGAPHAHVIGNEVQNSAEPLTAEGFDHRCKVRLRPKFRIELIVIGDVIAVRAAGPRFEERRKIDVAHAEPRQVGRDRRRLAEAEAGSELQAIGRARNVHAGSIAQRTLQGPSAASVSPQRQKTRPPTGGDSMRRGERLVSRRSRLS